MGLAAVVHQQVLDPVAEQRRQPLHQRNHITGIGDVRPRRRASREMPAAVLRRWPETVEDKVTDAKRAPQGDQGQIPVRMRAGRFVGNNRTQRMANQHSGVGADHAIHTCLDLCPHRVIVQVGMHLLNESDDEPLGQASEKP